MACKSSGDCVPEGAGVADERASTGADAGAGADTGADAELGAGAVAGAGADMGADETNPSSYGTTSSSYGGLS